MEYTLLYQAGIANLYAGDKRLLQHAYSPCEWMANGLIAAGKTVKVMHWDKAGDASNHRQEWKDGAGELWADKKMFGTKYDDVAEEEWVDNDDQTAEDEATYQREIALR